MNNIFYIDTTTGIEEKIAVEKILVIEQDYGAARLAEFTLDMAGYKVIVAHDGLEGYEKAITENPDLIILDVTVPVMNGDEICSRLWNRYEDTAMPVLVVTSKSPENNCKIRNKIGAENYLVKPVEPEEMLDRVTSLLSGPYHIQHVTGPVSGRQYIEIRETVYA